MLHIENAMQIINFFSFVNRFSVLHMLTGCDNTLIIVISSVIDLPYQLLHLNKVVTVT